MPRKSETSLRKALALMGPLEARIMRAIWSGTVRAPFVVSDVQQEMPELAYTTVMSTMVRLADKGLLRSTHIVGVRAHQYSVNLRPADYLKQSGIREVDGIVERFGDVALAAFETKLKSLSAEERKRLREMGRR